MARRFLALGLGGLSGLAVWCAIFAWTGLPVSTVLNDRHETNLAVVTGAACMLLGGLLFAAIGQALRLIPTEEQIDQQAKPLSIRSSVPLSSENSSRSSKSAPANARS